MIIHRAVSTPVVGAAVALLLAGSAGRVQTAGTGAGGAASPSPSTGASAAQRIETGALPLCEGRGSILHLGPVDSEQRSASKGC